MSVKQAVPQLNSGFSSEEEVDQNQILPPNESTTLIQMRERALINGQQDGIGMRTTTKYQIICWISIIVIIGMIVQLLNSNRLQEKEITSIIKQLEEQNKMAKAKVTAQEQAILTNKKINEQLNIQESQPTKISQKSLRDEAIEKLQFKQIELPKFPDDEIPKRNWYFSNKKYENSSLWTKKCFDRYKKMSQELSYEFISIDRINYGKYVSKQRYQVVQEMIKAINARYQSRLQPEIIKYRDPIIKEIITLEVLIENGGTFVDENIILTENMAWINDINKKKYINAAQLITKPKIVAFYSVEQSEAMVRLPSIDAKQQTQRYVTLYPGINSYFLAAIKNNQFLKNVRDMYVWMLYNPKKIKEILEKEQIFVPFFQLDIVFHRYFFAIASQIVLHQTKKSIGSQMSAIQHFQIAAINQNYGPTKIRAYLTETPPKKIMNHLTLMTREQLEDEFGMIRYMIKLDFIEEYYVELLTHIEMHQIINSSLIHEAFFQMQNQSFIWYLNQQKQKNQVWESLPAKVWTYVGNDQQNQLIGKIWLQHLQTKCNQSNFQLIVLHQDNLKYYLSEKVIKHLHESIDAKKTQLNVYPETIKQMIALAVLYEHGGVWLEPFTFLIDNLEWIRKINQEKFIWNKNGKLPKVLLSFHPHYGSPFEWTYDNKGIKQAWHLGYQNTFIAAEPKAQLIKGWLQQYIDNLAIDFQSLLTKFYLCKIVNNRWIGDRNHQLLPQDSIKCLLGAKKVELTSEGKSQSPQDYYGLWAINGFTGYLKLRENTNFIDGRNMDNPYIWRYSFEQMQDLVGKVHHFAKLYSSTTHKIQDTYMSNINNPSNEFHSKSLFMKLISQIHANIVKQDQRLLLKIEQSQSTQSLSKMAKTIWIYEGGDINPTDDFRKSIYQNIEHYAHQSQFQVQYVSRTNYHTLLTPKSTEQIRAFLLELQKKLYNEKSNLKDHCENIIGHMIMLTLLQEMGGIAISKKVLLHENLFWMKSIQKQPFINFGKNSSVKVFAFHSPGYSPKSIKNSQNREYVAFPSVESYFIAAEKQADYIKDVRKEFKSIVLSHNDIKKRLGALGYKTGWLNGDDPYYESFFLASQFVLAKKQQLLSATNSTRLAIDQYGLYTLNSRQFASRLNNFINTLQLNKQNINKIFAKMTLKELESYAGQLRYLSLVPKYDELREYITKSEQNQKGYEVLENSFAHQYIVSKKSTKIAIKYENYEKPSEVEWQRLPQNVWIFNEFNKDTLMGKIMFMHLNSTFSKIGYKVNEVNSQTIEKYLKKDTLQKWRKSIKKLSFELHKEHIYKLLLLKQLGGISISLNLITVEDVAWIKNIPKIPKEVVFNNFGTSPKVFMFVDQLRSFPSKWEFSQERKTKVGHQLGWVDDFLAAEPQSQLIIQWQQTFFELLSIDQNAQMKRFQQCLLKQERLSIKYPDKLRLDALQCVLNLKQKQLLKSNQQKREVCQFYQLWSVSEFVGLSKFENQLNVDKVQYDLNPFLWNWSRKQAESLIGKIQYLVRLSKSDWSQVQALIKQNKLQNWGKPNSLLMKTLYSSTINNLKIQNDSLIIFE